MIRKWILDVLGFIVALGLIVFLTVVVIGSETKEEICKEIDG